MRGSEAPVTTIQLPIPFNSSNRFSSLLCFDIIKLFTPKRSDLDELCFCNGTSRSHDQLFIIKFGCEIRTRTLPTNTVKCPCRPCHITSSRIIVLSAVSPSPLLSLGSTGIFFPSYPVTDPRVVYQNRSRPAIPPTVSHNTTLQRTRRRGNLESCLRSKRSMTPRSQLRQANGRKPHSTVSTPDMTAVMSPISTSTV